ncbi:YbaK/EbsC family protein [Actinoallomurus sp. NPDC052274]|uniref:YbaK/EbsC family protein n=1 Tax=Actinoallomurus sp. NPDC052274 TaxID=3155420 RepID=UPI00343B7701
MWGLSLEPALDRTDLLAAPVVDTLRAWKGEDAFQVAEIDPELSDTAAFCERYGTPLDASANCVIVAAKRGGEVRLAACVVLATTRADVNGVVRRRLDARKTSFAPQEQAVAETGMEYGGITPFGLPAEWPVLVDRAVVETPQVVVGSGVRRSKLVVPGAALAALTSAEVIEGLAR